MMGVSSEVGTPGKEQTWTIIRRCSIQQVYLFFNGRLSHNTYMLLVDWVSCFTK